MSALGRRYAKALLDLAREQGLVAGDVAAVMLETVTGTNGIIIPPEGYLQGVRDLCDKHGILLICDEVMSGFGRTGKWFAVDNWEVVPDLMTMAKGLTSAYAPLGAVAMRLTPRISRVAKRAMVSNTPGAIVVSGEFPQEFR